LKSNIRILGVDDAPFDLREKGGKVKVVGVVVRGANYLEGVLTTRVGIDGSDANMNLAVMINGSRFKKQLRVVMLDGIALGGFNVVDIQRLSRETGLAVVAVTRDEPDFEAIEKALSKHFEDYHRRWEIINRGELYSMETPRNPVWVKFAGIGENEVRHLLKNTCIRCSLPEPIRMAHIIASGITLGESRGRA